MTIQILQTQVFHKRFFPKQHTLRHSIFYLMFDINNLEKINNYACLRYNQFNLWSLNTNDYGFAPDGLDINRFENLKSEYHIPDGKIYFITVPKFLGHGFNPVSFFLFYDNDNHLRAVLSEVHNTFKERHCYLCKHDDMRIIAPNDILRATKIFHVSPFFPVSGYYLFQFDNHDTYLKINIDYYNEQNQKTLSTGIHATKKALGKFQPIQLALQYPFIGLKILLLIHYHAVILWLKKIPFFKKPHPPSRGISS